MHYGSAPLAPNLLSFTGDFDYLHGWDSLPSWDRLRSRGFHPKSDRGRKPGLRLVDPLKPRRRDGFGAGLLRTGEPSRSPFPGETEVRAAAQHFAPRKQPLRFDAPSGISRLDQGHQKSASGPPRAMVDAPPASLQPRHHLGVVGGGRLTTNSFRVVSTTSQMPEKPGLRMKESPARRMRGVSTPLSWITETPARIE